MAHISKIEAEKLLDALEEPAKSKQVAAICWRKSKSGKEILLITSRDTGRWIIPKGWPMEDRTDAQAARQEAWEEAGVQTCKLKEKSLGYYNYKKKLKNGKHLPVKTHVFTLKVKKLAKKFPEVKQRRRRWLPPSEAARLVREPQLRALLRNF